MSALLLATRRVIVFKTLLGICPFRLDRDNEHIALDTLTTAYTFVYMHVIFVAYPALALVSILDHSAATLSKTTFVASYIVHLIACTTHMSTILVTFQRRRQHADLLNALTQLHDRLQARLPPRQRRNVQLMHWQTGLFAFLNMSAPLWNAWRQNMNGHIPVYHFVYGLALTSILVMVLHVQELVLLVADCLAVCTHAEQLDRSEENMRELCNAFEIWIRFSECFGVQLLLSAIKDLFIASVSTYLFIAAAQRQVISFQLVGYKFGIFVMPLVLKNVWLVNALDRIEAQIQQVRRRLVKANLNDDDRVRREFVFVCRSLNRVLYFRRHCC